MPSRASARLAFAGVALLSPAMAAAGDEATGKGHGHRHELAGFIGLTNVDNRQRPTLGIGYEWRLTPRLGAGLVADWVLGGDGREFILAPAAYFRPSADWRFTLAAGLQRDREARELEGVLRLGGEYVVEVAERWSVAPGASVDFVAGETITVVGVDIGYAF